ncbi:MAG: lysine--tRNA ligase [Patescibacteria group bacterium]
MYWADRITDEIVERYKDKVAKGQPLVIRDEKTASGRVHVGSLRGVAIHGLISEVLTERGIPNKYLFEINDFDPMDGLPVYLDEATFKPYLGKPLCDVPSPTGPNGHKAKNFAEFYGEEFAGVIKEIGFTPEYYRSSDLYRTGKYNECIKLALEHADKIRQIYKRISGSVKAGDWLPINVICENCGKVSTTFASVFDGEKVTYECRDLSWTNGCGYTGSISPFDGRAKLPWKLEWAAKFKIIGVDVEGGGKDHSTKGGSRDIAEAISREIFNHEPPFNIPYEFFQVAGRKMSSSKGAGSASREIADLLPPEILRLLLLQKEPNRVIEFIPDGDTVPILFDTYDKLAAGFFADEETDQTRLFKLIHTPQDRVNIAHSAMPRFSQIAYLAQMPHLDIEKEVEKINEKSLSDTDKVELEKRKKYARIWIDTYAPEDYKFEIKKEVPDAARNLSEIQKKSLAEVLNFVESSQALDGQAFHTALHDIKEKTGIAPKEFFEAMYFSILGKASGPKAGWFLSVMDRDFLIKRLKEVIV